jgi:hypothetical protein
MDRIRVVRSITRALHKKPQQRSPSDIALLMSETEGLPLMTKDGPGVHRDLCHIARCISIADMSTLRLPAELKAGGGSTGALIYVSRKRGGDVGQSHGSRMANM